MCPNHNGHTVTNHDLCFLSCPDGVDEPYNLVECVLVDYMSNCTGAACGERF